MKTKIILIGFLSVMMIISSCKKFIDLQPVSNENVENFYRNYNDINNALTGCYSGLQKSVNLEWMLTELRTDNTKQQTPSSTSSTNLELNDLNMYVQNPSHPQIYNYWYATYQNIRNINIVLSHLGAKYNSSSGAIELGSIDITIDETKRKQLAGEALFLRAYHYFNLVRLFGGVFLLTEPLDPMAAKKVYRSSVDDTYKLITADLMSSINLMANKKFAEIAATDLGRANVWAAKTMLAKVYLTLNRKADALTLLNDVKNNSGYSLRPTYAEVFAITNEMNAEILFAVRYKAGGFGIGSPFANRFAPTSSGTAIVNGDGEGLNYPTSNIDVALISTDLRKITCMNKYSGSKFYVAKYLSPVMIKYDAENDFPVIRFADVILMLAEAEGYSTNGVAYINQIKNRAGLVVLPATVNTQALFEAELLKERRLEFAFENQRFFDLVRFNQLIPAMQAYYSSEYSSHYSKYKPALTLVELQARLTVQKQLLPVPQREIDTNTELVITQNPGY